MPPRRRGRVYSNYGVRLLARLVSLNQRAPRIELPGAFALYLGPGGFEGVARSRPHDSILQTPNELVHHPALQGKGWETEITHNGHFKNLRSLANGKNVKPFCRRPE